MGKVIRALAGRADLSLSDVSAMSRPFAILARGAAVALLGLNVVSWFLGPWTDAAARGWSSVGSTPITLSNDALALALLLSTAHLAALAVALFAAGGLFQSFAQGEFFAPQTGRRLQRIGLWLALFGVLAPIVRAAMTFVLTMNNPPGQRMLALGVSANDIVLVIVGGLIFLIGWVMAEAARIADENRSFV